MKATGALGVGTGVALTTGTMAAAETGSDVDTNSFDNSLTPVVLNPGAQMAWAYIFAGADHGFQIAGPNILPPQNGARHTFFNPGKSISSTGSVTYFVTIRNDGAAQSVHNLEGGGVI